MQGKLSEENINKENIYGLVLAGGKSSRMGIDKAMLSYNGLAQQYFLYQLLEQICNKVFISCNQNQSKKLNLKYNKICDDTKYSDIGPMAGLLSFCIIHPNTPALLVGCDYPFLTSKDLSYLLKNRKPQYDVVCYNNEKTGFDEPLIAVYETNALKKLKDYFENGNTSLRHFLSTLNTNRLKPLSTVAIKSVDTIEEAKKIGGNTFL